MPILIDIRDQWPDIYLKPFPRPLHGLAQMMLWTEFHKMRSICRRATGITAVSQTYFDWALTYAGRGQGMYDGVFPLGYPATTAHAATALNQRAHELQAAHGIRSDALVISFVGIFGLSYDLETVIEAARLLHAQGVTQVQFVLAGDGDKGKRLRNLARGIDTVIFPGWLDERSIHALLKLSSIGLAPYVKGALQSLPNKPFEYMAAGLPILSSLQGELETLITNEHIGKQYQPGNAQSLVDQVRWFLDHPDTATAMGKRSRRLLEERFSTETVYARLADRS
ncbi:MAG: glycosyltransferase family 4 protein [Chloroflexaceae bacterium]|nr:glycosyltransferase family 4 protein [Chloroflexaceae bacterium]